MLVRGHPLFHGVGDARGHVIVLAGINLITELAGHGIAVDVLGNLVVRAIDGEGLGIRTRRAHPVGDAAVLSVAFTVVVGGLVVVIVAESLADPQMRCALVRQWDIFGRSTVAVLIIQLGEFRVERGGVLLVQSVRSHHWVLGDPVAVHRIGCGNQILGGEWAERVVRAVAVRVDQNVRIHTQVLVDRGINRPVRGELPDQEALRVGIGQRDGRAVAAARLLLDLEDGPVAGVGDVHVIAHVIGVVIGVA